MCRGQNWKGSQFNGKSRESCQIRLWWILDLIKFSDYIPFIFSINKNNNYFQSSIAIMDHINRKNFILVCSLLLSFFCTIHSQCPRALPEPSSDQQIHSDHFSLEHPNPSAQVSPASSLSLHSLRYTYTHSWSMGEEMKICIAISGYEYGEGADTFRIEVEAESGEAELGEGRLLFVVRVLDDAEGLYWKRVNVNFIMSTRRDIEIHTLEYQSKAGPQLRASGHHHILLHTKLKSHHVIPQSFEQEEQYEQFLKTVVFLSSVAIDSPPSNQPIELQSLQLSKIAYTPSKQPQQEQGGQQLNLQIIYHTTAVRASQISILKVHSLTFSMQNPVLRFHTASLLQNMQSSQLYLELPNSNNNVQRVFMVGLASLHVPLQRGRILSFSSDITVSKQQVFIEMGGNRVDNGEFRVEYLVLEVYSDCEMCGELPWRYGSICVPECPPGYKGDAFGICSKTRPTCPQLYFYNQSTSSCTRCPRFSKIPECNNPCPFGSTPSPSNNTCIPQCPPNSIFKNSTCICLPSFHLINNLCQKCPTQLYPNTTTSVYIYNEDSQVCERRCPGPQVYSQFWRRCVDVCGEREMYNGRKCVCEVRFYYIEEEGGAGRCGLCGEQGYDFVRKRCKGDNMTLNNTNITKGRNNENEDNTTKKVLKKCGINELWMASLSICMCERGYYRIGEKCGICPDSQQYDPVLKSCGPKCRKFQRLWNNTCSCTPGFYRLTGHQTCTKCQIVYGPDFYLNTTTNLCEKKCQKGETYSHVRRDCVNECQQRDRNSQLSQGVCRCKEGFLVIKGPDGQERCGKCPEGLVYLQQEKVCIMKDDDDCSGQDEMFVFDNNGKKQCICLYGYQRTQDNQCIPSTIPSPSQPPNHTPNCPPDTHFSPTSKTCTPNKFQILSESKSSECAERMVWNGKQCVLKKDQCWQGYQWNEKSQFCIRV